MPVGSDVAAMLGTLFGVHQHGTPAPDEKFSEFCRPRPHQLRLRRPSRARDLGTPTRRARHRARWHQGCVVRLGRELRDPDGIALEFFGPPS